MKSYWSLCRSEHHLTPFFAVLCLLLTGVAHSAQNFSQINSQQGLKSPIIRDLVEGPDGFIWMAAFKGLYRFDGQQLKSFQTPQGAQFEQVMGLTRGHDLVWVRTAKQGLYYHQNGRIGAFSRDDSGDNPSPELVFSANQRSWLIYADVILEMEDLKPIKSFTNPIDEPVLSAARFDDSQLLLATRHQVYRLNTLTHETESLNINSNTTNRRKQVLHQGPQEQIWLGRSDGLYSYQAGCDCFVAAADILEDIEISAFDSDDDSLWVGTIVDGLYHWSFDSKRLKHHSVDERKPHGLQDNSILSVAAISNEVWLGTFNSGVNYFNQQTLSFGATSGSDFPLGCVPSDVIFDVHELAEDRLLLATDQGFSMVRLDDASCTRFHHQPGQQNSIGSDLVFSFFPHTGDDSMWITTASGIDRLELNDMQIAPLMASFPSVGVYYVLSLGDGHYLSGTNDGLYRFNPTQGVVDKVRLDNGQNTSGLFYQAIRTTGGAVMVGSNGGLFQFEGDTLKRIPLILDDGTELLDITGLVDDGRGGLLVAAEEKHLLRWQQGQVQSLDALINAPGDFSAIYEMLQDASGLFWMSSDRGLFRVDLAANTAHQFRASDGLQSDHFLKISSHQGASGKLYFGGRNGFNAFYPDDISINETPPKVVVTAVSQLNKSIGMGQSTRGGFVLEQPLEQLDHLQLNHRDLDIGFEFAALDYADPARNQYAYRLLGFNDDWQYVGADNRRANFTNLKPGEYTFQVKAANKDGVWNTEPRELSIRVYPAPWFSPWAYAAYVLTILALIWGFIRYKTIASRKRAKELEVQVAERTQEVVQQKRMVESLLDHKNEVFANVTHEFKTPLSLIVGPADQLAEVPGLAGHEDKLSMIRRNAQRLLLMVGQILKLSQAEQEKAVIREVQGVQPVCLMLYESFAPLAADKGIELVLDNEHDVNVYATHECLDMVVGNLLSNAIKYTPSGGQVTLSTRVSDGQVLIGVSDTGPGISDPDKDRVFNRFVRLDGHQGIQGTGIGLAVVKEVTVANKGHVQVLDNPSGGARFVVSLPVTDLELDGGLSAAMTEQLVNNTRTEMAPVEPVVQPQSDDDERMPTVLIIEDNPDMQQHTLSVLKDRYRCVLASRGDEGIGQALKEVPDIIICDVMMPGMDGYQVTRVLRNDPRTSHIPIILLTALNTRESRIKGWREKIDRYVTKPFDAHELHAQLENILSVRQLLQNQTAQVIEAKGDLGGLDLTKQDVKFLDQLKAVITEVYDNEYIQKADLADRMAVSERQLQRKVKALIGLGPLDMLREYRLEMGKAKLQEGLQVSQVSDLCGFSSVSYFGTCFKKKYGMTPKQYQQLGKPDQPG